MKIRVFAQVLVFALLIALVPRPASAESPQPNPHSTAPDDTSSQCESVEPVTPGDTVTDDVSDVSAAHIDITEINTSLSGETLTVVFHLRDLPESLTFDRTGLGKGTMEYSWEVAIDVDNDRGTGDGGFEYLLSAYHITYMSGGKDELTAPIGEIVEASTWEVHPTSFSSIEDASVEISAEADTITLTGQIPGITSESRLTFETSDAQSGFDRVACLAPFRTYLGPLQCGSGGVAITPGQTVADESGDAQQGYIDIIEVSSSLSGETLTVVFHLRDVPETLTFNRSGIRENLMEYSWEALINVDNNMENGDGGYDYLLSAYHIVRLTGKGNNSEAPIEDQAEASIWTMEPGSTVTLEDAGLEVSAEADTITLTGTVPGITSESRLSFRTYDYGLAHDSDSVGCQSSAVGDPAPTPCSSVEALTPGDTVTDDVSDVSAAHIDITAINTSLSGETLTVIFHLRDIPESLSFDRAGLEKGLMEYDWEAAIDVDNDRGTGVGGFEYLLSAYHIIHLAEGRDELTVPIGEIVEASIWEVHPTGFSTIEDASVEISAEADTITLTGEIPGITSESRLAFETSDTMRGRDHVECHAPYSESAAVQQCESGRAVIMPGRTVADRSGDATEGYIDITEVSSSLSGETLTAVFHLRDVPESLTFDRKGVPENALEYNWEVSIDVDGAGGYEYTLAANHFVHHSNRGNDRIASIAKTGIVQANTWERDPTGATILADASLEVSTQDKTITLSGDIPGITAASRLAFETYDYFEGSDAVGCQTSLRPSRFSNACTPVEGAIVPGETVTDGVSDDLAAHVDITEVSTALAGETLAVILQLRDLPESLVFDRTGVDRRVVEYYWKVLIDLDRNQETGTDGFEYALSASHAVQSRSEGSNAAASIGSKIQAGTWKTHGGDGYMQHAEASVLVSADANTITLVGNIPGITPDARLEFEAHDFLEGTERVGCLLSSLSGNAE